ncbi:MAG: TylF/MycF family methyltransferase [Pseudomonadota bacterium]
MNSLSETEDLYIELLKKTLSFSLWPEPPVPLGIFGLGRNARSRKVARSLNALLAKRGLMLAEVPNYSAKARAGGEVWPGYADTMVGRFRLDNLETCIRTVVADGVPGDFIETGVWRGGSCILMRGILKALGETDRRIFVADSFEGLPPPEPDKHPADKGDVLFDYDFLAVSEDQVRHNFERYGLLDDQVVFIKGFFADSLPKAPIEKLAILRLDGDMYSSTIDALNALYHKLSPGGFCIVDDYGLPTCEAAIQDFRKDHGITEELIDIDNFGKYWRKAG